MKKAFFVVAVLFLFSCSNNKPTLLNSVTRSWHYVSAKDSLGNDFKKVSEKDILRLTRESGKNNFNYDIETENIHASGTWQLIDSSLVFTYSLVPKTTDVDSAVYSVTDGMPVIIYFKDGKEITRIDDSGVNSRHTVRFFRITECTDTRLTFKENGITFILSYTPLVSEGSITLNSILRGLLGVLTLLLILWLFSNNRKAISWRLVGTGLVLQLIFAIGVLKVDFIKNIFEMCGGFFVKILSFTHEGAVFIFGNLTNNTESLGFIFAFQILPTILFFSALTSVLYYMGVLQKIVYGIAWVMSKTMKLSGAESLSAAGNIFLGQTESPLLIRHYLPMMTRSEILCVMIGGMATIAGGVMAAYIGFLGGDDPVRKLFFAKHLLAASVMSAPAAIVAAKMLFPQTEEINTKLEIPKEKIGTNVLESIANGTVDGLRLAVNVGAMLIVFIAMIAMANYIFLKIGALTNLNSVIADFTNGSYNGLTLQFLLGYIGAPLTWLMGVCKEDMVLVGQLLGEKTVLNEFVAYVTLGKMQFAHQFAQEKSVIIATYILCGFSNFASIGIQIGGIGALAPNQKTSLSQLGIKALIGGTVASLFTAVLVGMII
ncbi:MAG: Na+ dependent nucleoside transporter [Bacteroidia bacterium]|nr:Na+ dependent nucleoside transporter [Bacteroidia bacterium]